MRKKAFITLSIALLGMGLFFNNRQLSVSATDVDNVTEAEASEEATTEDIPEEETEIEMPRYDTAYAISFSELTVTDANGTPVALDPTQPVANYVYNGQAQYPVYYFSYNGVALGSTIQDAAGLNPKVQVYRNGAWQDSYENYESITPGYTKKAGQYRIDLSRFQSADYEYYWLDGGTDMQESIYLYFNIAPKNITDADVTWTQEKTTMEYTGEPLYPKVTGTFNGITLVADRTYNSAWDEWQTKTNYDYTIAYANNDKAGTATITVTGAGNYTGTREFTFTITKLISLLTFNSIKNYTYTGKAITPTVTAKDADYALVAGTDFTVTYSDNVKYGEATITITGAGYYSGTHTLYFGIVPKKISGVKFASPKKLQAKLTWKKSKGAAGYEIARYNAKTKEYDVLGCLPGEDWQVFQDASSDLKHNKKYKYRIRPYVVSKDGETKYYGNAVTKDGKVTKSYREEGLPIYTGCPDVDYAAEVICRKIIKKGMSKQAKVKAIYDWVALNCTHNKDYGNHKVVYDFKKNKKKATAYSKKIWKNIYNGKADCNFDGLYYNDNFNWDVIDGFPCRIGYTDGYYQFDRGYECFATHQGGCSYITRMFKVLINHVGLQCTLVDGNYVNTRKEKMYHYWCYIRVNGKYAWYDPDVAASNKKVRHIWYKRDTKFWKTCHEWDAKNVPMGIPDSLK